MGSLLFTSLIPTGGFTPPLPVILTAHGLLLPAYGCPALRPYESITPYNFKVFNLPPPPLYPLARKGLASNGMIKNVSEK